MTQTCSSPRPDPAPPGLHTVPGILLAGSLGLLLWLLFREIGVSVLLAAAIFLLWPHRRVEWAQSTFRLLIFLGSLWIVHKARMVVYPLLAGTLVAYWIVPLVDRMERRRIPRALGALFALLPTLALGAAFALLAAPMLVEQLGQLVAAIPVVCAGLYDRLWPLVSSHLPPGWQPGVGGWLSPLASQLETVVRGIWGGAAGIGRGLAAFLGFLAMIVLAPVLTYYLLVDYHTIGRRLLAFVPDSRREQVLVLREVFETTVRSYFRGQVLVALCVGLLMTTGFLVIGLPYAIVLGFLAGILNLVPVIGFWTSTALCVLAAALSGHAGPMLLRLAIVLAVEQFLEGQVFTPRIVGRAVGLNPAVILVAVLAFGTVLGPLGVVVAVPAVAMGRAYFARQKIAPTPPAGTQPHTD